MDITHLLAFLLGTAAGAGGHYFGQKFTDQRRNQEAKAKQRATFKELAAQMPALFREIKADLDTDGAAFTRDIFILPTRGTILGGTDKSHFIYYESEHPALREKLEMVQRAGFVADATTGHTPHYQLQEQFVEHLKAWRPD